MLYIGMFFFSLAIVSGMLGFAGIGAAPDRIALLVFFSSLLVASITFASCLLRTAGRAQDEEHDGTGGWQGAEDDVSALGTVRAAAPPRAWHFRSASRSMRRLSRGMDEGRAVAGRVRVPAASSRLTGGISQEV
jgi:uncharacterized membrane protein YtjA (UPF0391 family)